MPSSKIGGTNEERVKRETAVRERMFKKEKDVLDRTMDASLRAMEREYKEVVKKQTELVTVKSGIFSEAATKRAMPAHPSRSNLAAAASNRQLTVLYSEQGAGTTLRATPSEQGLKHITPKPEKSSLKQVQASEKKAAKQKAKMQADSSSAQTSDQHSAKGTTTKAKGGEKKTVSHDQHPPDVHQASDLGHSPDGRRLSHHHNEHLTQRRDSVMGPDHSIRRGSMARRGSQARRDSITGQIFTREEMEEQQRILDLFIHMVDQVDGSVFDPTDTSKTTEGSSSSIHEKAHQRRESTHHAASGSHHSTSGSHHITSGSHHATSSGNYSVLSGMPSAKALKRLQEDPKLMKDLQGMLARRRLSIENKGTPPLYSNEDHRPTPSNGHGKKRRLSGIEMLSDILGAYKTQYVKDVSFDPLAMLNCGYLRLSDSNVRELERLCREQGIEPGIHAHSNVTDFRLFD